MVAPGLLVSILFILSSGQTTQLKLLSTILLLGFTAVLAILVLRHSNNMLLTLSNLTGSIADGDYSMRGTVIDENDKLCQVFSELNQLADSLKNHRYQNLEQSGLIENILESIDIAVLAFDNDGRLTQVNQAANRLFDSDSLLQKGHTSYSLDLAGFIETPQSNIIERQFPGQTGYWQIQLNRFRQDGQPRDLLLISNVSKAFKAQERHSWQQLLRVLGHELNNSLTPIHSMSDSLLTLLSSDNRPPDWQQDIERGITVINKRTQAIAKFMQDFSKLAKLPEPSTRLTDFKTILIRCCQLLGPEHFDIKTDQPIEIVIDPDQIEQLLINLLKNAIEASDNANKIEVNWFIENEFLQCEIIDSGSGIANFDNLFVPFFSTKQSGSGIGLVLSRQIAEAHEGALDLHNRAQTKGCVARLMLPL